MAAEMTVWGVRALVLDVGVDLTMAHSQVRDRVEALDDDTVRALVAGPWLPRIKHGLEMIDVLTADWSSAQYRQEVIAQVKQAIMDAAIEVFFSVEHPERCRFVDSVGQAWIISGGMAEDGAPTGSCYTIGMLSDLSLAELSISLPTQDCRAEQSS